MGKISVSHEKWTKHLTLKVYPLLVGVVGLAIALLIMGRYWTTSSDPVGVQDTPTVDPSRLPPEIPATLPPTLSDPIPKPSTAVSPQATPSSATEYVSNLRVSNRTNYPIRVALLPQKSKDSASPAPTLSSDALDYDLPAHWDFAPGEGSRQGLFLSLPDRDLQLQPGDVLVAFAQDGSRLYWGPYVVGSTPLPLWNAAEQEWQLVLEP